MSLRAYQGVEIGYDALCDMLSVSNGLLTAWQTYPPLQIHASPEKEGRTARSSERIQKVASSSSVLGTVEAIFQFGVGTTETRKRRESAFDLPVEREQGGDGCEPRDHTTSERGGLLRGPDE